MTKKGIIYETLGSTAGLQVLESQGSNEVRLSGVFGVCGIKNGNNRIYEKSNYGKMVTLMQERMQNEKILGELEHPNTMNITLENVSHMIEEIKMNEDGTVTGTIRLLDTPKGKIAKAIIEGGAPLYISSRGAGSIDESGHVTLTALQTYDLVGTPGFSQAKLTLTNNQKFECLNESLENPCYMIVESEEEDTTNKDDNKDNDNKEITMEDIKKSIDELSAKVEKLESELHVANEAKEAAEQALAEIKESIPAAVNYEGIQEWIQNEYAPVLRESIKDYVTESIKDNVLEFVNENYSKHLENWIIEEFAPQIQNWTINEFGQKVQDWVVEEYSAGVHNWVAEEFASTLQNWINEEYSATLQKWINEEFAPEQRKLIEESVNKNVSDFLESQEKEDKFAHIDELLEKLENGVNADKILAEQKIDDKYASEPCIKGMPMNLRPMWEALSDDKKDYIIKNAHMYDFTKAGVMEKFWASQNMSSKTILESQKETATIQTVQDPRKAVFTQMKRINGI